MIGVSHIFTSFRHIEMYILIVSLYQHLNLINVASMELIF